MFMKLSDFFIDAARWAENDLSTFLEYKPARLFYRLSKKVYSKNFCKHCGHYLELCYNGSDLEKHMFCCNCCHVPD